MSFNIIQQLRATGPGDRPAILKEMYQNNLIFFESRHPALLKFLKNTHCPYRIDITESFLNIIDERSGQLAHPEVGLDRFAEMLGGWTHEAWVDLFNFQIPTLDRYPKHHKIVHDFSTKLHQAFPELSKRLAGGRINLKQIDLDKRFSPPVVFLGIFHGLQIATYLEKTDLTTALFIEPEPERFEVSCYFLDYAEIEKRFGTLYLAIGEDTTAAPIESFFSLLRITPMMWTRVLYGYPFDKAYYFIESIKSLQATSTNLLYPLDNELDGLIHGAINLNQGLPLLTTQPRVSKQCKVAVVATGPSLENDLDWLKKNQQNLIIFAVHSSVKILRKHGITPDFQFNLDAIINFNFRQTLELFPDVPFVTDYKAPPHIIADFEHPLLCADTHKNSAVHFHTSLTETHPSTTNLAFSFACFLNPASIYLLGCDCGYRKLNQDHAKGSFYEESRDQGKPLSYAESALQSLVEPNFSGTEPIQTISQHLRTKIVIERCITANATNVSVINLSDGALIAGAQPQRSINITLHKYNKKQNDIKKILTAFSPAKEKINWEVYTESGSEKLHQLKTNLMDISSFGTFSWKKFSQSIDAALGNALSNNLANELDHRMDCYCRVIGDLLCLWYRCIILFDDIDDAEKIYIIGLRYLKESLEELQWPNILDRFRNEEIDEHLSFDWQVYLAQFYGKQGNFVRAEKLVSFAYDQNGELKDNFVRLGWMLTEKRQWQKAFEIAVQDEKRNRLSPIWQVHLAQLYGRRDEFDHAIRLIETAYATDADLKDGFARLGWIHAENRSWSLALQIAERDLAARRISPGWKVNIAQLLGRIGDFEQAATLINNSYLQNPKLRDGFARLGWIKMETRDWNSAHEYILKDYVQERISPTWKIYLAIVKGCLQLWSEAMGLIAEAYFEDSTLSRDGYSRLGWWGYLLGNGEEFFHDQITKEKENKSSSVSRLLLEALYLTVINKPNDALKLVKKAYRSDPKLENWQTILGWLQIRLGNFGRGLELMKNDHIQGRMNHAWLASYAIALGICGQKGQAMDILQNSSLHGNNNVMHPIGFTVFPEAWMTITQLQFFVTSGMDYDDLKDFSNPSCISN